MPKWMNLYDAKAKLPYEEQGRRYTISRAEGIVIADCYYTKLSFKKAVEIYRRDVKLLKSGENSWRFLFSLGGLISPIFSLIGLVPGNTFSQVEKSFEGLTKKEINHTWTVLTNWFGKFVIEPPKQISELGLPGSYAPIWILKHEDGQDEVIQKSIGNAELLSTVNLSIRLVHPDGTQELIHYQGDSKSKPDDYIFPPEILTSFENQSDGFSPDLVFADELVEHTGSQSADSSRYPGMLIEATPDTKQNDPSDEFNPDLVFATDLVEHTGSQSADSSRYPGILIEATPDTKQDDPSWSNPEIQDLLKIDDVGYNAKLDTDGDGIADQSVDGEFYYENQVNDSAQPDPDEPGSGQLSVELDNEGDAFADPSVDGEFYYENQVNGSAQPDPDEPGSEQLSVELDSDGDGLPDQSAAGDTYHETSVNSSEQPAPDEPVASEQSLQSEHRDTGENADNIELKNTHQGENGSVDENNTEVDDFDWSDSG